jgi:hypothetical protein
MTRETVSEKARRYLIEGRLRVERVEPDVIWASCRGDGAIYSLGWTTREGWHCDCPARGYGCCHVTALRLVTATERSRS